MSQACLPQRLGQLREKQTSGCKEVRGAEERRVLGKGGKNESGATGSPSELPQRAQPQMHKNCQRWTGEPPLSDRRA